MKSILQSIRRRMEQPENHVSFESVKSIHASSIDRAPVSGQNITLLELFQSQSCDSCPPTNANLIDLTSQSAAASSYLLLTYHVTYWNHLNWIDTFSHDSFDSRQRDYVRKIKNAQGMYTPMLVVNGRSMGIGNTREEVTRLIREGKRPNCEPNVQFKVEEHDEKGEKFVTVDAVSVSSAGGSAQLEVLLITYIRSPADVFVSSGENAGSILPHRNIVTEVSRIGYLRRGGIGRYSLAGLTASGAGEGRVLLVQDGRGGQVLGVSVL